MENEKGYELSFTAEQINVNLGNAEKAVLFTAQSLTPEQQAQVRQNIGCSDSSGGSGLMRITITTEIDSGESVPLSDEESAMLTAATVTRMPCIIEVMAVGMSVVSVCTLMYPQQVGTFAYAINLQDTAIIFNKPEIDNPVWYAQVN